eukprot:TRINITY_DN5817_c0_g1_i1.p1 TRINITY_DN5817_c0_g1~~TRINITY_DN5817_c0_g1_i1.p1  ORF type:complete len:232 (+),score=48.30 TRINITY_DN5817_c0_g1_i1:173-868(+)
MFDSFKLFINDAQQKIGKITEEIAEDIRPTIRSIESTSKNVGKAIKEDFNAAFEIDRLRREGTKEFENRFGIVNPFTGIKDHMYFENFNAGIGLLDIYRDQFRQVSDNNRVIYGKADGAYGRLKEVADISFRTCAKMSQLEHETVEIQHILNTMGSLKENIDGICCRIEELENKLDEIQSPSFTENIDDWKEREEAKLQSFSTKKQIELTSYENEYKIKKAMKLDKKNSSE